MLRPAFMLLAVLSTPVMAYADDAWVTVGNPGNTADETGLGSVDYDFQIMKYEVTVGEYAEFLNQVAAQSDPHQLWVRAMGEHVITDLGQGGIRKDVLQCIERQGSPGAWTYLPVPEREAGPVFFVSFFSALRYANWLHHDRQNAITESGAYELMHGAGVERSATAKVWLPSENEWYKAAYFQPEGLGGPVGNYWRFPMCTQETPVRAEPGSELPNAACFSRGFGGIAPVGSYPNALSPWGALDMGGNVWEWTDTITFGSKRVLRGGSSPHNVEKMQSNVRSNASPDRWYPDTGFRLARRVGN
jgi:formylglycine-generating enzyme required for sulfatase activity